MVYLHVPFCRSFCIYCDFYSCLTPRRPQEEREAFDAYADAVCGEIQARKSELAGGIPTFYIGGGTPSVLPPDILERLAAAVQDAAGRTEWDEWTVEVNPDDIVRRGRDYVEGLSKLGVNRISIGIQSFDDDVLKWMRRRHDAAGARKALSILRESGIPSLSLDLIFGFPGLTDALWDKTLDEALAFRPEHISAYQLGIEEGSVLGEQLRAGRFRESPEEVCRRQYDRLCRRLADAGYRHYEISNFALPGREAKHNSAYWRRVPYAGLGPGAHSLRIRPDGVGVRSWNSETIPAYHATEEVLDAEAVRVETLMLGLRTDEGLPEDWLRAHTPEGAAEALEARGELVPVPGTGRLRIPERHFFISDLIISALL